MQHQWRSLLSTSALTSFLPSREGLRQFHDLLYSASLSTPPDWVRGIVVGRVTGANCECVPVEGIEAFQIVCYAEREQE